MTKADIKVLMDEYNDLNDKSFKLEFVIDGGSDFINPADEADAHDTYRKINKRMKELEKIFIDELGEEGFWNLLMGGTID